MDTIKTLVQNLILIVVLTVFLEMLLPSGIMRRYVKVVMGLVVVVAVLQTASGLLHKDFNFSVPAITNIQEESEIKEIMSAGQKLAKQNQSEALYDYRKGVERQILAIANLNEEVEVLGVVVKIQDNPESKDYGQLREINLTVSQREKGEDNKPENTMSQVEPVSIQVGNDPVELTADNEDFKLAPEQEVKIKETVASFYNLSISQIKVNYQ